MDRANDIATAKAEIRLANGGARYIDLFLLKRLQGEWKIISKSATRIDGGP
ncbi:MAG: nuclear transport factor 2 family protein [Acidobacteriota bacterium]